MLKQKIQNKIIANSPYQLVPVKKGEKAPLSQVVDNKQKEPKKNSDKNGLLFEPENLKPFMTCPDVLSEDLEEDANELFMNMSDQNTTINEYVNMLNGENQRNLEKFGNSNGGNRDHESNNLSNDTRKTLSLDTAESYNNHAEHLMRTSPSEIKLESSEILTYQEIGNSPTNLGSEGKFKFVDIAKSSFQNRFNQSLQKKNTNGTSAAFSNTSHGMKLASSPNAASFKKNSNSQANKGMKSSVISKSISSATSFYNLKNNYKSLKLEGKENTNPLRSSLGEFEIPKDSHSSRKESVPSSYNSVSHRSSTNQSKQANNYSPSKTVEAIITPRALMRNSEIVAVRNSDTFKSIDLKAAKEALRSPTSSSSNQNTISYNSGSAKHSRKSNSGKFPTSMQINLIEKMEAEFVPVETSQEKVDKYINELDSVYTKLKEAIRSKHEDVYKNQTLIQYLENLKALASGTYSLIRDLKSE